MSKILIIDDEPSIRELYRFIFSDAGHEVLLAEHGLTAGDLSRDETLIKLGKAVGARRLLCGSVSKGEKEQLVIRARLLDPETGMALGSETETAENIYTLMEAVRSLAAKLSEY